MIIYSRFSFKLDAVLQFEGNVASRLLGIRAASKRFPFRECENGSTEFPSAYRVVAPWVFMAGAGMDTTIAPNSSLHIPPNSQIVKHVYRS